MGELKELRKIGFCKSGRKYRAVCLRECPLGELPLYVYTPQLLLVVATATVLLLLTIPP